MSKLCRKFTAEQRVILDFHDKHALEGYRRLTFMMSEEDIVAVSPSITYRVLKTAGRLDGKIVTPSKKCTGPSELYLAT